MKRYMKNGFLICSVFVTLFLVYQIWFSSYFLPDRVGTPVITFRNMVINPVLNLFHSPEKSFSQNLKSLFVPKAIVVNFSGERRRLSGGSEDFDKVHRWSEEIMNGFLSGEYAVKTKESVDLDHYCSVLRGQSVYVEYGSPWDFRLFSTGVCGDDKNAFAEDIKTLRGYIISLHDNILNDVYIYMMDETSNNIYRYTVECNKADFEKKIKTLMSEKGEKGILSYSYELNFHKQQTEPVSKVSFHPMVLLELVPVDTAAVTKGDTVMLSRDSSYEQEFLNAFAVNTRAMNEYTDLEGAKVFVENNATLTLHPDGYLDYQTVEGGRGLKLDDGREGAGYDIYKATNQAVDFVTELCNRLSQSYRDRIRLHEVRASENNSETYYFYFDYCLEGIPVMHQSGNGYVHAVTMEIEKGYLKAYRQYMNTYEGEVGAVRQLRPVLSATDTLVDSLYTEGNSLKIDRVTLCYADEGEGEVKPKWNISVQGTENLVE